MKNLKWEDLKFRNHQYVLGGVACRIDFDNGEWCSIVGAPYRKDMMTLYGDGVVTFEIWSSSTNKTRNGVKGWLSKVQVVRHLNYLKNKENK
jgi:hypothetical protein